MSNVDKKPRILHSAALLSPPSGILAQMVWEQEAANTLGIDWRVRMYCPKNTPNSASVLHQDDAIDHKKIKYPAGKLLAWIQLRRNYHRWLLQQQDRVDIYLLRYYVHDPYQLAFVSACKKPVYFVHHTLEGPELALPGGVSGFVRSGLESAIGRHCIRKAEGIIGVTQEIVDYELGRAGCPQKKSYVYPNGIVFKDLPLEDKRSQDVPELLFVANFAPWHGLDILLKEVAKSQDNFILHLVGKVPDDLMALTKDPRIQVHGAMNQQQIIALSAQCWVGLSSFALKRNEMKQACPLKVREYLMLGLPVYGDYQDVFYDDFRYFKKGSENLSEIMGFCRAVRSFGKQGVADASRGKIDKKILLAEIYNKFRCA